MEEGNIETMENTVYVAPGIQIDPIGCESEQTKKLSCGRG
jgi:hypothetical protein